MKIGKVTYNGQSSDTLGVFVSGAGSFNAAELDTTSYQIPGRNGDLILQNNRYKNIDVTYPAFIPNEFETRVQSVRNWLRSSKVYARLEDNYDPDHFRMGVGKGVQTFNPGFLNKGANMQMVFNCKPQRFLKTGEDPFDVGVWGDTTEVSGDIVNFEAEPDTGIKSAVTTLTPSQSETPWIDSTPSTLPYIKKAYNGGGNREADKIIGGTVAWNQLASLTASDWQTARSTLSVSGRTLTVTTTSATSLKYAYIAIPANHKVLCLGKVSVGEYGGVIGLYASGTNYVDRLVLSGSSTHQIAHIFTGDSTVVKFIIGFTTSAPIGEVVTAEDIQIFDLTSMFGPTIADYIYSLESNTAGAGVAWFRNLFPEDYYAYDPGSLQSVNVSAHITKDANDTVVGNYALDSSLTLRGLFKLDANNNLYADGDEYPFTGSVTRKYGTRAYQSGDESLADAITDGTNTVYKLNSTTTESADPYTASQEVVSGGTEEYTDYGVSQGTRDVAIPVGHSSIYSLSVPIVGHTGATLYVSPTQNQADATSYPVTFTDQGTVYGGTLDFVSGTLTVDKVKVIFPTSGWTNQSTNTNTIRASFSISASESTGGTNKADIFCDQYPVVANETDAPHALHRNKTVRVWFDKSLYPSVTAWQNFLASLAESERPYVVVPLATPITYQLTANQISTLLGQNYVWCDEGSIKVEYGQDPNKLLNPTQYEARPVIKVTNPTQGGTITANGTTMTCLTAYTGEVTIDCETMNIYSGANNLNSYFSGDFPVLSGGVNAVSFTGADSVEIIPRWWEL